MEYCPRNPWLQCWCSDLVSTIWSKSNSFSMRNARDCDDKYPIGLSWCPWRSLGLGECQLCHSWVLPRGICVCGRLWDRSRIWGLHQGVLEWNSKIWGIYRIYPRRWLLRCARWAVCIFTGLHQSFRSNRPSDARLFACPCPCSWGRSPVWARLRFPKSWSCSSSW